MTEPAREAADRSRPAILYVDAAGKLHRELSVAELAKIIRGGPGELWVDMNVSSRQCLAMLDNVFAFHPLAVEDALNPVSRVKVDEYPGFLFAIVRGVRFVDETEDPYDLETFNLSFFLGPNYLVTVHGDDSSSTDAVRDCPCTRSGAISGRRSTRWRGAISTAFAGTAIR